MKQATNPKMPELGSSMANKEPILGDELVYQLTKCSSGARMLSQQKKDFLLDILDNKKDILDQCIAFDSILDTPLHQSLASLIPVNKRVVTRESGNADLANMVANLLYPLKVLRKNIMDQYKEEKKRKSHSLRSSANESPTDTPVLKVLHNSFRLLELLEKDVYAHRSVPTIHTAVKPIKLTSIQRQRKWTPDLVPIQHQLQLCVICGHKSTNLAPENRDIIEFNRKKEKEFILSLALWDEYIRKVTNGDTSINKPKGLKRRPQRRSYAKEPIILCKCSMSYCLGEFEEKSNSCPIKCIKSNNHSRSTNGMNDGKGSVVLCSEVDECYTENLENDRYPFVTEKKKYCSCPICQCKCSFHCTVADVPKVLLLRKVQHRPGTTMNTNIGDTTSSTYDPKAPFFFKTFLKNQQKSATVQLSNRL